MTRTRKIAPPRSPTCRSKSNGAGKMRTKIAVPLTAIALTLTLTLASPPSFAAEPPPLMVAYESIELYDSIGGDFQKANEALISKERCQLIFDVANITHVEKSERDYLCLRQVTANEPHWPRCYWIDGRKLRRGLFDIDQKALVLRSPNAR